MWADSKIFGLLEFGSTVQKLFNVEMLRSPLLLHKKNVKSGFFQHSITVEPNLKNKLFWNLPKLGRQVMIFYYFMHLNHLSPLFK